MPDVMETDVMGSTKGQLNTVIQNSRMEQIPGNMVLTKFGFSFNTVCVPTIRQTTDINSSCSNICANQKLHFSFLQEKIKIY